MHFSTRPFALRYRRAAEAPAAVVVVGRPDSLLIEPLHVLEHLEQVVSACGCRRQGRAGDAHTHHRPHAQLWHNRERDLQSYAGLGGAFKPAAVVFVADLARTRNMKVMRRVVRATWLGEDRARSPG